MKKMKLALTLNKETVANLNNLEMNRVIGGTNAKTKECGPKPSLGCTDSVGWIGGGSNPCLACLDCP